MGDLDPNILIDISKTLAGVDERTKAFEKAADHRHANVMQAIQNFVPRREIEAMNSDTREYAEELANSTRQHCDANREIVVGRVSVVEEALKAIRDNQRFIRRAVIGGAIATGIGLIGTLITWIAPLILVVLKTAA